MSQKYTEAETIAWEKTLGGPITVAMAVLQTADGRILVVQPNYKPGLSLPGGLIDPLESPLGGLLREVSEEIGLSLPADRYRFLALKYRPALAGHRDSLHMLFTAQITDAEMSTIKLQATELDDYKLMTPAELLAVEGLRDTIADGLDALIHGTGYYEQRQRKLGGLNRGDQA